MGSFEYSNGNWISVTGWLVTVQGVMGVFVAKVLAMTSSWIEWGSSNHWSALFLCAARLWSHMTHTIPSAHTWLISITFIKLSAKHVWTTSFLWGGLSYVNILHLLAQILLAIDKKLFLCMISISFILGMAHGCLWTHSPSRRSINHTNSICHSVQMQQKLLGESSWLPKSQFFADESFVSGQFVNSSMHTKWGAPCSSYRK